MLVLVTMRMKETHQSTRFGSTLLTANIQQCSCVHILKYSEDWSFHTTEKEKVIIKKMLIYIVVPG